MLEKRLARGGVDRTRAVVGVQASEKPGAAPDSPPSRVWVKPVSSPAPSPYRSKLEAAYANSLEMAKQAGEILRYDYEPISFKLANGKRYRPDFVVVYKDHIAFHEVKGRWMKNRRDGMTHLIWAAQRFPMFRWILIERERGAWIETVIDAG